MLKSANLQWRIKQIRQLEAISFAGLLTPSLTNECLSVKVSLRLGELPQRFAGRKSARLHFSFQKMHLLYLDDAGSAENKTEQYLVVGGISVYEAQAGFLTNELDQLAESISPGNPHAVEFHASEIFARRNPPWNKMSKTEAQGIIKAVLQVLANSYDSARAFACAIHKCSYPGTDPIEQAFEDLCSRFDRYLARLRSEGDRQRGLIILDESSHETSLQTLARDFRTLGTKWGIIRNLAETPLFVNSKASRIVQLADHVAYAVFRRYNASDTQYFDIIASKFDASGGVIHGLAHKQTANPNCMCPACLSRRITTYPNKSEAAALLTPSDSQHLE